MIRMVRIGVVLSTCCACGSTGSGGASVGTGGNSSGASDAAIESGSGGGGAGGSNSGTGGTSTAATFIDPPFVQPTKHPFISLVDYDATDKSGTAFLRLKAQVDDVVRITSAQPANSAYS